MTIKYIDYWMSPSVIIIVILIILSIIISANGFRAWCKSVRLALSLPGPPAVPLFGNVFMIKDSTKFLNENLNAHKKYGSPFRGWITLIPVVLVTDPKHIQTILGSTKHVDKNFLYSFMHTFLGEGLLTNSGAKWKLHRKLIQPYFHMHTLKKFISTFTECSQLLAEQLQDKSEVKISTFVNDCVLNILHRALLGIPVKDYQMKEISPFNKGHVVILQRILQPWYIFDFAYKFSTTSKHEVRQQYTLFKFAKKILDQRRQSKKTDWCLLDCFIDISENNENFADEQIINEICTFMLAGQDSVGAAVAFTLYNLAKHPEIQDKVVEELNSVFRQHSEVNMESLNGMKYLEQCIKESLRLYPSVPLISKRLAKDVQLGNYILPAGLNILISPLLTQRIEEYYPNPDQFDPERFSPTNQENSNPYAFIPFSAGPRNCIGYKFAYLEIKTIVATILRRYKISENPTYKLELMYRVTLRAKGGIKLQLQPRQR